MRRSRKPFRAVRSDEGSNPSPSAFCSTMRLLETAPLELGGMLAGGVEKVVAKRESDRLGPAVNAKLAQDVND